MAEIKRLDDSFNARYLDYDEIANLFVNNKQYDALLKSNHTLLMGPRGSGKTTLLKMLTVPAQYYWHKEEGKISEKNHPSFYSVYIPTDVQWKKQIDDFEQEFQHKNKYKDIIIRLIVTTNILISISETFINLIKFKEPNQNDLQCEAELALQLIEDWKLKNQFP